MSFKPPPLYEIKEFDKHREHLEEGVKRAARYAANLEHERKCFLKKFEGLVRDMLASGVAVVTGPDKILHERHIKKPLPDILRDIQLELGRPVISAVQVQGRPREDVLWQTYWRLRIPRNPRLKAIASMLLLVSDNHAEDTVVIHEPHERIWVFLFVGDKGKALFEDWLHKCRTDPVYRVCLDLPILPPEVNPH